MRTIHASAPIRICDNGGWTDTWVARHGKVFTIAVRPRVRVRVDAFPRGTRIARIVVNAENYALRYAPTHDGPWGPQPLIEAALRAVAPPDALDIEVTAGSRAPAGASTGTSAALAVALLGALDRLTGGGRTRQDIARLAHALETEWLGGQSGVQDQLSAVHGGINFIEVTEYPRAVATQLRVSDRFAAALQRRLALIYLGRGHSSSRVHETVMESLERMGPDCSPLNELRSAALAARDAVLSHDFHALGLAMRRNTDAQAALHEELVHPDAWRVIETARTHGALGWKVNGAGGDGGSITLLCDESRPSKRAMVRAILAENPAFAAIPHAISRDGLRVW